jgi:hypothetical protein
MADEVIEPVAVDAEIIKEPASRGAERNQELANKVKTAADERDAAKKLADEAVAERDFYKNLTKLSTKYPNAADFEDKILERVKKGYDMEEATVAVLNKAGKLPNMAPKIERETVAGGSAINNPSGGTKSVRDMNQTERLQALREAQDRGDLSVG